MTAYNSSIENCTIRLLGTIAKAMELNVTAFVAEPVTVYRDRVNIFKSFYPYMTSTCIFLSHSNLNLNNFYNIVSIGNVTGEINPSGS